MAIADFDSDGDQDLYVSGWASNKNESIHFLFRNDYGKFIDIAKEAGIKHEGKDRAATFIDYDNDGYLDLYIVNTVSNMLYSHFEPSKFRDITKAAGIISNGTGVTACFADFDHDGDLDLYQANETKNQFFRNNLDGTFTEQAEKMQITGPKAQSRDLAFADFDDDGDMDIFISGTDGSIRLLRNDGGNVNRCLKVQLVGIRTGSGKNNYFGIGAKLEVRAGDLYQTYVVTKPVSHFGLGQHTKADVVRILWTNGVPQNLFEPGSDQELVEQQILKGSCPFLYAWDGEKYEFVTDILWRSALGMPLGIMGGETAYAFSDPSQDYFKIPGEMLQAKDGIYSLQLTDELWETAYFDPVKLFVVDHPDTADIFVDERFTPPPYPPFNIYKAGQKRFPISVADDKGNDLRKINRYKDDVYVSNLISAQYQGITEPHDEEHQQFLKKYITRKVTTEHFRRLISEH